MKRIKKIKCLILIFFGITCTSTLKAQITLNQITLKYPDSEASKTKEQKKPQFNISGFKIGDSVALIKGANCIGDEIEQKTATSEIVEFNIKYTDLNKIFNQDNYTYYLSSKRNGSDCSNNLNFKITNREALTETNILPRSIKIEEFIEANAPNTPSFKVTQLQDGDEINLYKSERSDPCKGSIVDTSTAEKGIAIFIRPNLQPGGDIYISAGLINANPPACTNAIFKKIPVIDPPFNSKPLMEFYPGENSKRPSFKVIRLTGQNEVSLYKSPDKNKACQGMPIATKTTNENYIIFNEPTEIPAGKKYYFSAKIKNSEPGSSNCLSSIIDFTRTGPNVTLYINHGVPKDNVTSPEFYISGVEQGYSAEIFKDAACTGTPLKKISATDNKILINLPISGQKTHKYYARGIDDDGTPGKCTNGVEYTLDTTTSDLKLRLSDGEKSRGSEPHPKFKVSGTFTKGDILELFKSSKCTGTKVIHTLRIEKPSNSEITSPSEREPLVGDSTFTFSVKSTDKSGNKSCSNDIQYTLDTAKPYPQIKLKGNQKTDSNASPSFIVTNISPGDKVTVYSDSTCKRKASKEIIVPAQKSSIEIKIDPLQKEDSYSFWVNAIDSDGTIGTCSRDGATYTFNKPNSRGTGGGGTGGGGSTSGKVDLIKTLIQKENDRVEKIGIDELYVKDLHPTQITYGNVENQIRRATAVKKIYCDKNVDDWKNEHLIPYVISPEGIKYFFDGHHTNKILSDIYGQAATTKVRLIRDYRKLGFNDEEFKKDMTKHGWVWLHDTRIEKPVENTFNPNILFNVLFDKIKVISNVTNLKPDPFRDIAYLLQYGINPKDAFTKFDHGYKIKKDLESSAYNPPSLPFYSDKEYIKKIINSAQGLFNGHKWGLYIRYRLKKDYGVTFAQLAASASGNNFNNFSGCRNFKENEKVDVDDFFMLNLCRAHRIARDSKTRSIYDHNPAWLPGLLQNTHVPDWCDDYQN